jgi:hypothetical protein
MHSILRSYLRGLGINYLVVTIPLALYLFMHDHWPSGFEGYLFTLGLMGNVVLLVDGLGLWWYLRRKNASLSNVAELVFRQGVSWGYLREIERFVEPAIILVEKHCPEVAHSPPWVEALQRQDYVALSVIAAKALRRNRKTIERAQRRHRRDAIAFDAHIAALRKLGVSESDIAKAATQGLQALSDLVNLKQTAKKLDQRARRLEVHDLVSPHLEEDDVASAESLLNNAENILQRAKTPQLRSVIAGHLSQGDFSEATRLLDADDNRQRHQEFVGDVEQRMKKLPVPVQAELRGMISGLNGNPVGSKPYKVAKSALERRLSKALQ